MVPLNLVVNFTSILEFINQDVPDAKNEQGFGKEQQQKQ
jgi:hypothetical protein